MKFFTKVSLIIMAVLALFVSACSEKSPEQIAAENKKRIELSIRRSAVLLAENKKTDAIVMLEGTRRDCGETPELCKALAEAYVEDNKPDFVALYYEKASDLVNGNAEWLMYSAKAHIQANSLEAATKVYAKYLKIKPNDAVAWKLLAECFEKMEKYNEALDSMMSAVKVSGRSANATEATTIGNLFIKLGNFSQAKTWLGATLDASGTENIDVQKKALIGLATIYLAEKDVANLEKVVANLDKIDRNIIDKEFPALRSQLADFRRKIEEKQLAARLEEKRKQEEAAKKREEEILKAEAKKLEEGAPTKATDEPLKPTEDKAQASTKKEEEKVVDTSKNVVENSSNKPEEKATEGVKDAPAQAVVSPSPDNSITVTDAVEDVVDESEPLPPVEKYIARSNDMLSKGEVKKAEKFANMAVFEDKKSTRALRTLAEVYEAQKRHKDAFLVAEELYKLNPDDINATLYYIRCSSRVVNNEKLLNILDAAREKFPNNMELVLGLARTYKIMGDDHNAKHFYAIFVKRTPKEHKLYQEVYNEYEEMLAK